MQPVWTEGQRRFPEGRWRLPAHLAPLLPLGDEPAFEVGGRGLCRGEPRLRCTALLLRVLEPPLQAVDLRLRGRAAVFDSGLCWMMVSCLLFASQHVDAATSPLPKSIIQPLRDPSSAAPSMQACTTPSSSNSSQKLYLERALGKGGVLRRIQQLPDLPPQLGRHIRCPCQITCERGKNDTSCESYIAQGCLAPLAIVCPQQSGMRHPQ